MDRATVIHANKYSQADGVISFFIFSSLYTDIVFRLSDTNDDLPCQIRNLDLPIYTGEEVVVLRVANIIVGYMDVKTQYYYFVDRNLGKRLGLGIANSRVWLTAVLGCAILCFIAMQHWFYIPSLLWFLSPLFAAWIFLAGQRAVLNRKIKRSIHQLLTRQ